MPIMTTGQLAYEYEYVSEQVRDFWEDGGAYTPVHPMLFKERSISQARHEDVPRAGVGKFSSAVESEDVIYDSLYEGKKGTALLIQYHQGFAVTERAKRMKISRDIMRAGISSIATARDVTLDSIAADLLNYAFLTSKYVYRDALAICSTAHEYIRPGSGTGSNRSANGTDIGEGALEQAVTDIDLIKTDEGFPGSVTADRGVINPAQKFNWARAVQSMQQPGSANNDINALKTLGYFQNKPIEWKMLSSTKAWFVLTKGYGSDGLLMYKHSEDSDTPIPYIDEKNGNTYVRSVMFRAAYVRNWRALYGNPGGSVVV